MSRNEININRRGSGIGRFPEIQELATPSLVLSYMECPACKEVPFPPIHNCQRGHIICSECKPKLKFCPMCKAEFSTEGRNYAIEAIIMNSTHRCRYLAYGCPLILKGEEMEGHISKCTFRTLSSPCHLGRHTLCSKSKEQVPLPNYLAHLKQEHMMLPGSSGSTLITTNNTDPCSSKKIIFESNVRSDVTDTFWLGDYIIFDKQTFIVRQFMRNRLVYVSLAVIGDEKVSRKYVADIEINAEYDKVNKISWTMPTHSIMLKEEEIMDSFSGTTTFSYIKAHAQQYYGIENDKKKKINFNVQYAVRKREK